MNNTIKRTWNQGSMVNIEDLRGMAFQAESGGHTFVISAVDADGNAVSLSGTPSGTMLRPDNTDQALTCSISGGKVYATLPAGCYDVPGRAGITIFLTNGGQKAAIYAAVVSVTRTQSGTASPGTTASVVDLVNAIAAAVATIPASYTDLMSAMAPTYSSSGLYAVGSYAWYNGKLYRCTTAITSGETWTSGHWTLANLGSDLVDLKSALNVITAPEKSIGLEKLNSIDTPMIHRWNTLNCTGNRSYFYIGGTFFNIAQSLSELSASFDIESDADCTLVGVNFTINSDSSTTHTALRNVHIYAGVPVHLDPSYALGSNMNITQMQIWVIIDSTATAENPMHMTISDIVFHGLFDYPVFGERPVVTLGSNVSNVVSHSEVIDAYEKKIGDNSVSRQKLSSDIFTELAYKRYTLTFDSVYNPNAIATGNISVSQSSVTNIAINLDIEANREMSMVFNVLINTGSDNHFAVGDIGNNFILMPNNKRHIAANVSLESTDITSVNLFIILRKASSTVSGCVVNIDNITMTVGNTTFQVNAIGRASGTVTITTSDISFPALAKKSNVLNGKQILFLGDSISDTHATATAFPAWVATLADCENINYAVASAGYSMDAYYASQTWGQENTKVCDMIERAYQAGVNPDFVVMAAGTNDWDFYRVPFGKLSDIENDTMTTPTFYFYVAKAIKTLLNRYPLVNYLVIIPTPRNQPSGSGNQHTVKTSSGKTLIDYCNAIKEICNWYSIPYLNMIDESNMHLESDTAKSKNTVDGLHPSSYYAHYVYAPMVIKRIESIGLAGN